ncbi:hypothetical protein SAMN06265348_102297 [Pedobacter westerhofensis]|uniref:Uncharacterized protein n=1 Tax=Pedobacter westerhofensis TaxID=425512 RepID=A0A521BH47_9SPHI|nr:hypothetical protein [Pedobacter westerhofensis]SMO46425.1 hypothetical protein SAMN06265348_102297 [Pedobacter westerhofensis]
MTEPYYQVDFIAVGCKFEILINDLSLLSLTINSQASTLIPLNSGIFKTGQQKLEIKIYPLEGQEFLHPQAAFSYEIKIYDVKFGFELKDTLGGDKFPAVGVSKKLRSLEHVQNFHAEVPYVTDTWQKGQILADVKDLNDKLKRAYSKIAMLIRNKEYERLKMEFANREQTMATAMYLSKEDSDARLSSLIEDIEAGFEAMPVHPTAVMRIFGSGKLAAYKKLNGEPAFGLLNHKTGEELLLDLAFYVPQGSTEFELI